MIYSGRPIEVHTNRCSVKADSVDQAHQKFLSDKGPDCYKSEFVSTVGVIQIEEDQSGSADLRIPDDDEVVARLKNILATATMQRLMLRFEQALERIEALEGAIDNDEDNAYPYLVNNNWHGLRGFIAGMKDELKGSHDEDHTEAIAMLQSVSNWLTSAHSTRVEMRLPVSEDMRPLNQYLAEHESIIESIQDADDDTVLFVKIPDEHLEDAKQFAQQEKYFYLVVE